MADNLEYPPTSLSVERVGALRISISNHRMSNHRITIIEFLSHHRIIEVSPQASSLQAPGSSTSMYRAHSWGHNRG